MSDQATAAKPKSEHELLSEELHLMKTSGIIEVAVRNPSVAEYMRHWEDRATKAEDALAALQFQVETLTAERDEALAEVARWDEAFVDRLVAAHGTTIDILSGRLNEAVARNEALMKALDRQCDNMAFVVNHVTLHNFYDKFLSELEEDRAALSPHQGGSK